MSRTRKNANVKQLRSLLEQHSYLFQRNECQAHINALIRFVTDESDKQLKRCAASEVWSGIPAAMQTIALARQRVAHLVIDAMAKGLPDVAALREVVQMAALSRRGFKMAYPGYLHDDWQALRTLRIENSFVAMRNIQLWVDAQLAAEISGDAYIPLCLVDEEVLHATPSLHAARRAYA